MTSISREQIDISYKEALKDRSLELVIKLFKSGKNPDKESALNIALGNSDIPPFVEAALFFIINGSSYRGLNNNKLSEEEKLTLNQMREYYLKEGQKCIAILKESFPLSTTNATPSELFQALSKLTSGQDIFINEVTDEMLKKYNSLDITIQQEIQANTNKVISFLNNSNSYGIVDYIHSLGGYRYNEPAHIREVHTLVRDILLTLSDPGTDEALSGQSNNYESNL